MDLWPLTIDMRFGKLNFSWGFSLAFTSIQVHIFIVLIQQYWKQYQRSVHKSGSTVGFHYRIYCIYKNNKKFNVILLPKEFLHQGRVRKYIYQQNDQSILKPYKNETIVSPYISTSKESQCICSQNCCSGFESR